MVAWNGFPKIVGLIRVFWLVRLLSLVAFAPEVLVQQTRSDFVSDDGLDCWQGEVQFAAAMMGGPIDGVCGDLGLVDATEGLGLRQPVPNPAELGRVHAGQLHHRDMHAAFVVNEFAAQ